MSNADLIARLRGPAPSIPAMRDAADEIERLNARIVQMRREHNEEMRDAARDARESVAEARWQERQGEEYGSY